LGLWFGGWGFGPQPQIPNPQSPIPNPQKNHIDIINLHKLFKKKKDNI
jgi:hypothetical protein